MVPLAGLEPARLSTPDFESGASTNSATGADREGRFHAATAQAAPESRGIIDKIFLLARPAGPGITRLIGRLPLQQQCFFALQQFAASSSRIVAGREIKNSFTS